MKRGLALSLVSLVSLGSIASADTVESRVIQPERGDTVNEDGGDLISRRIHTDMIVPAFPALEQFAGVTSNVIFMNKCTGGCLVSRGPDDSRTNRSSIVNSGGTLPAFPYSADVWTQVMTCMQGTFAPFNVTITDVDPGSADHLEVLVGNNAPSAFGFGSGTGGVAPFACQSYVSNALVFDFAGIWGQGTTCGAQCVVNICATAAQEIAHTWALDHEIDSTDPMTYYGQNVPTPRHFKNASVQCGSDCQGGTGPNNETCTGPNIGGGGPQSHACSCTGQQTQNSFATVSALFGNAAPSPPIIHIDDPANGAMVNPGFPIHTTITDTDGISKVELRVDNTLVSSVTAGPYYFNAPQTLGEGTHHVEITAYDIYNTSAKAFVDVIIGMGCHSPADCPNTTDTCVGGACIAGSGVPGGLGAACTDSSQCLDGECANGNMGQVCVVACNTGGCPSGYGCVTAAGSMAGVCYPGFDDGTGGGGGGCSTSGGSVSFGLGFAALLVTRRRRRQA